MVSQFFGNYLNKNNQITTAQMDQILEYQSSHRAKLGLIAVAEGMLTEKQGMFFLIAIIYTQLHCLMV